MAVNFLNNVDLNNNQLLNARVHVDTNAPSGAGKGSIWLNSTTNELNFHNGSNFVSVLDDTTIANTQNVFTSSFVDSADDVLFRLTKSGASSGTQDIKFVAGNNVTLTPSGDNMTIASVQKTDATIRGLLSASGVLSYDNSTGAFSSSAQANVDTDLGKTTATTQITITSSTGDNVIIGEATGTIAGLMSTTHHDKLDTIENDAKDDQTGPEIRTLLGTGNSNLVPAAPASGSTTKFLRGDGTFQTPSYIANTTTGAQMTESTLRSKLALISSSFTIGDATDVTTTVAGGLIVAGALTVNGGTTTVNSTTVTIDDPVFTLGGDGAAVNDSKDRGIEFKYHDGENNRVGFFGYDDSLNAFVAYGAATNTSEVFSGTLMNAKFGTVTASFSGALTGNVSGSVSGSAGTVSSIGNLTGDVTSTNRATTIGNDKVTYAKMQNVSTTNRILGRDSSGAGNVEEITPLNVKTMLSLNNVDNVNTASILGGNLTGQINSVAVATVTAGAAAGATANQDSTASIQSGTTATNVGLGNVTDESKSTMFTDAALTGDPTAPTQTAGDSSTKIATTAFVAAATASIGKVTKKLTGITDQLTYNITHSFGTPHVIVQLLDYGNNGSGATYDIVYTDVKRNDDNSVTIAFGNNTVVSNTQDYLVLITKMPAIS